MTSLRRFVIRVLWLPFGGYANWLAATLEMWCPLRGCGFESRALRCRESRRLLRSAALACALAGASPKPLGTGSFCRAVFGAKGACPHSGTVLKLILLRLLFVAIGRASRLFHRLVVGACRSNVLSLLRTTSTSLPFFTSTGMHQHTTCPLKACATFVTTHILPPRVVRRHEYRRVVIALWPCQQPELCPGHVFEAGIPVHFHLGTSHVGLPSLGVCAVELLAIELLPLLELRTGRQAPGHDRATHIARPAAPDPTDRSRHAASSYPPSSVRFPAAA